MQQSDRTETAPASTNGEGAREESGELTPITSTSRARGFDWLAVSIVLILEGIFAVATRLNTQPSTSLIPIAVLSATGCGLFITGARTRRTLKGAGIGEAALAGLLFAIIQFLVALSYPGVVASLVSDDISRPGFLTTWGLVALFSAILSMGGAALGHLAFAPLRPVPEKKAGVPKTLVETTTNEEPDEETQEQDLSAAESDDEQPTPEQETTAAPPRRSIVSYVITIVLLGLAPTLTGYMFAAAFDFALNVNQYIPGPYPTLRLLSALLPWQVPLNLPGAIEPAILYSWVWRIPLLLGNPQMFDIQAIEPLLLNAAGLCLLLLGTYTQDTQQEGAMRLAPLVSFEALLGLILVLPADAWMARGLEGLFQLRTIVIPIRTLPLLNPLTFTLNLVSALLVCMLVGLLIRRLIKRT